MLSQERWTGVMTSHRFWEFKGFSICILNLASSYRSTFQINVRINALHLHKEIQISEIPLNNWEMEKVCAFMILWVPG